MISWLYSYAAKHSHPIDTKEAAKKISKDFITFLKTSNSLTRYAEIILALSRLGSLSEVGDVINSLF
ncbi:hypothetical protein [Sulfurisphaera ohwakuensis]|uniref:hypothetical protein n=1 Tax=Sulfurisphaera ohwakuensis TaxID=69656 RepID=UPI0036F1ED81